MTSGTESTRSVCRTPCIRKQIPVWIVCFLLLFVRAVAADQPFSAELRELQDWILSRIQQPKYEHAFWGIKIQSLETGETLFDHNSTKLFTPASNMKLVTVAAALDRLGADYRIRTSLLATNKPGPDGALHGDLIVYGRGDPLVKSSGNSNTLETLALDLKNFGVGRVTGDLVADESYFRGPQLGSGWMWDDLQFYYGAEISPLTVNENVLSLVVEPGTNVHSPCRILLRPVTNGLQLSNRTETLEKGAARNIEFSRAPGDSTIVVRGTLPLDGKEFTDKVPVHQPAKLFLELLRNELERVGIRVEGQCRCSTGASLAATAPKPGSWFEVASIESPPLRDIVHEINKRSHNLFADLLLAHLGEHFRSNDDTNQLTSEELGVRELGTFLKTIGITTNEFYFEEGSGLSRDTLISPNAIVKLLGHMQSHQEGKAFIDSLPSAGVDGSLRNRMKDTVAIGKIQAKTGRLRWTVSLSGYATTAAGERLAFSFMLNRYQPTPDTAASDELDAIAVRLAALKAKSK